jgi:hypothetical protein
MAHDLHQAVGKLFSDLFDNKCGYKLLLDPACGESTQHLSFFLEKDQTSGSRITKVDLLVLKENKVKLVCEIEESEFIPRKIYGKFTSLIATSCLKTEGLIYSFDKDLVFIQIVSGSGLKEASRKRIQWKNIEDNISMRYFNFPPFNSIYYCIADETNYKTKILSVSAKI